MEWSRIGLDQSSVSRPGPPFGLVGHKAGVGSRTDLLVVLNRHALPGTDGEHRGGVGAACVEGAVCGSGRPAVGELVDAVAIIRGDASGEADVDERQAPLGTAGLPRYWTRMLCSSSTGDTLDGSSMVGFGIMRAAPSTSATMRTAGLSVRFGRSDRCRACARFVRSEAYDRFVRCGQFVRALGLWCPTGQHSSCVSYSCGALSPHDWRSPSRRSLSAIRRPKSEDPFGDLGVASGPTGCNSVCTSSLRVPAGLLARTHT
jgi:hypothetical protein